MNTGVKYLVSILIILAVIAGYCLGTLDEPSREVSYTPLGTLNYVILAQKTARDTHQRIIDHPGHDAYFEYFGTSLENERQWVRLYDMTIEILESLQQGIVPK